MAFDVHLVRTGLAVHYQCVVGAKKLKRLCDLLCGGAVGYAQDLTCRTRGVSQRSEDVEYGTDAYLRSQGTCKPHGGMEGLSEHESDAGFVDAAKYSLRSKQDVDPKSFEHISAPS